MILIITLILGLTIAKPTNYQLKMKNKDEKSFLDNYGDNYDDQSVQRYQGHTNNNWMHADYRQPNIDNIQHPTADYHPNSYVYYDAHGGVQLAEHTHNIYEHKKNIKQLRKDIRNGDMNAAKQLKILTKKEYNPVPGWAKI